MNIEPLWNRLQAGDDHPDLWLEFAEALRRSDFSGAVEIGPVVQMFEAALQRPGLDYQRFAGPLCQVLWQIPEVAHLRTLEEADDSEAFRAALCEPHTIEVLSTGLLGSATSRCVIPDSFWERLLTRIRRTLLDIAYNETNVDHPLLLDPALGCVLAQQCWLNGFVFFRSSDEDILAHRMAERLLAADSTTDPADLTRLSALACYDGLLSWGLESDAIELATTHPNDLFLDLLFVQVSAPITEREASEKLETIGEIENHVSEAVRARNEKHPYPRWTSIDLHQAHPFVAVMQDLFPAEEFTELSTLKAPRVLIAGCGTGRAIAMTATSIANACITGVDLSRASLAYGSRAMSEFGYQGLDLYQADVLSLVDWDARFDLIDCSGVLHQLEDPMAGWQILVDLLEPGGLMKVSLPSDLSWKAVLEARDQAVAQEGPPPTTGASLRPTPGEIRALRHQVLNGDLNWPEILERADFWTFGACQDLLFPIQEHGFTIPEIGDCITKLGMEFIGFEKANPGTVGTMYDFWLRKPPSPTLSDRDTDTPTESTP